MFVPKAKGMIPTIPNKPSENYRTRQKNIPRNPHWAGLKRWVNPDNRPMSPYIVTQVARPDLKRAAFYETRSGNPWDLMLPPDCQDEELRSENANPSTMDENQPPVMLPTVVPELNYIGWKGDRIPKIANFDCDEDRFYQEQASLVELMNRITVVRSVEQICEKAPKGPIERKNSYSVESFPPGDLPLVYVPVDPAMLKRSQNDGEELVPMKDEGAEILWR